MHISELSRSENDQKRLVYWLSYAVIRMICLTTGQKLIKNFVMFL